jgi:hypothetical protein
LNQPLHNWRQALTSEGKLYYYNRETRVSTWHRPEADVGRPGPASNNGNGTDKGTVSQQVLQLTANHNETDNGLAAVCESREARTVRKLFDNAPSSTVTVTTVAMAAAAVCFCPFCGDRCAPVEIGTHMALCKSRLDLERDQPVAFAILREQLAHAVTQVGVEGLLKSTAAPFQQVAEKETAEASSHGRGDSASEELRSTDTYEACEHCGRTFAKDRLALHAKNCEKVFRKKRPTFNSQKTRLDGTPQKQTLYGGEVIFCQCCGKGFDEEGLHRHMKAVHPRAKVGYSLVSPEMVATTRHSTATISMSPAAKVRSPARTRNTRKSNTPGQFSKEAFVA